MQPQHDPNTVNPTVTPYTQTSTSRRVSRITPIHRLNAPRLTAVIAVMAYPARSTQRSTPPKRLVSASTGTPASSTPPTNASRAANFPSTISRLVSSDDRRKSSVPCSFSSVIAPPTTAGVMRTTARSCAIRNAVRNASANRAD